MKIPVKKKIDLLVIATAFIVFIINIILTALLQKSLLIWIIGGMITVLFAYFLSEMFSRGIEKEMENFLDFTRNLGRSEKGKRSRPFYDDLFLESAKNINVYLCGLQSDISQLQERKIEFEASFRIMEKCLSEMKTVYFTHVEEGKKSSQESQQIIQEVKTVGDCFKNIRNAFGNSVDALKESSDTISRMAVNSQELQSCVSDASSSVEQMSVLISDEIGLVDQAKLFSGKASETAGEGGKVVSKAVAGMNRIVEKVKDNAVKISDLGKSSDEIGEIIATIDEIADQTNLLALNAAIEAARAGEQGRGFAVVADEIRKLAERTTKATKEIADTINAMQEEIKSAVLSMEEGTEEVEKGVILTDESGKVLNKIVEAIGRTNNIMSRVDENAKEQSARSSDMKGAVKRISMLSQSFNVPYDKDKGEDIISEKMTHIASWVDASDVSFQNLSLAQKGLSESLDRVRMNNDSLDTLESRMSEIITKILTGKDSLDKMIDGDSAQ